MTSSRAVAVLAVDRPPGATPPGVDPSLLRLAMVEDCYELVAEMALVDAVLALSPGPQPDVVARTWPGTPVVTVPAPQDSRCDESHEGGGYGGARVANGAGNLSREATGPSGADGSGRLSHAVLAELAHLGYTAGAVVTGDAPDLPALLIGKLFRALGRADVAVCPAEGGGLVALAATLPAESWLGAVAVGLDTPHAVERLRAGAPSRRAVGLAPGWHRLRSPGDLSRLDPGLEGWESTRAVLSGRTYGG